jgi:hypothetical protein
VGGVLSDPNYYTAFRSVFRNPTFGSQFWNPQERDAMARVNRLHMRSGPLGTASMGFALPLVLDPDIKLINAGPEQPLARAVHDQADHQQHVQLGDVVRGDRGVAWGRRGLLRQHPGAGSAADPRLQDG